MKISEAGLPFEIEGALEALGRIYVRARLLSPATSFEVAEGATLAGVSVERWVDAPRAHHTDGTPRQDLYTFCLKDAADRARFRVGARVELRAGGAVREPHLDAPGAPPSDLRGELRRAFGEGALEPPVLCRGAPALRFELALDGSRVQRFAQAFERAREIARRALAGSSALVGVLEWCEPAAGHRSFLRAVHDCGVRLRRPRCHWSVPEEEGGTAHLVAFHLAPGEVDGMLWGALAGDLGIRPSIPARVFIADVGRGILLHPYDDRGMDVVGPNRALLRELYDGLGTYLLEYDRERMDASFATGANPSRPPE